LFRKYSSFSKILDSIVLGITCIYSLNFTTQSSKLTLVLEYKSYILYLFSTLRICDKLLCESLAQSFMEDGRWEEVFPALYGSMLKYKYYMETRENGKD